MTEPSLAARKPEIPSFCGYVFLFSNWSTLPFKTKPELINKERMDIGRQLAVSAAGVMCLEMAIEVRSVINITGLGEEYTE